MITAKIRAAYEHDMHQLDGTIAPTPFVEVVYLDDQIVENDGQVCAAAYPFRRGSAIETFDDALPFIQAEIARLDGRPFTMHASPVANIAPPPLADLEGLIDTVITLETEPTVPFITEPVVDGPRDADG